MALRSPYHIGNQNAFALLAPISATLAELETRAQHYTERLRMADADRETIARAQEVLARARAEIEQLRDAGRGE
jgi:hypothetical protein